MNPVEITPPAASIRHRDRSILRSARSNESVEEIRFIGPVPAHWGITVETTGNQTHEFDFLVIKKKDLLSGEASEPLQFVSAVSAKSLRQ